MARLLCLIFWFSIQLSLRGQTAQDSLRSQLTKLFDQEKIVGMGVAIVDTSGILFKEGYGFCDLKTKTPYSSGTIQNIGSISKTFIGIAIMKAVELGKLSLDDPVNDYLSFQMINPYFPNHPILVRHLASHTSSLKDNNLYERSYILHESSNYSKKDLPKGFYKYYKLYLKNEAMSMKEFTERIASSDGMWFKKKNYWKELPGAKYSYSNVGAGIAALVLEQATGMSFPTFTQKYILDEFGMDQSGWSFEQVDKEKHTTLYFSNFERIPQYSLITYPDGGMLTNVDDLSRYLIQMMIGYARGNHVLTRSSSRVMMRDHTDGNGYGLFWEYTDGGTIGHNGGDPGVATFMYFDPEAYLGQILFVNTSPDSKEAVGIIEKSWRLMKQYAKRL